MSEKTFTISEDGTNKQYNLVMSYNSSEIDFNLQNKDDPKEKYELKGLTLPELQKKNKVYKQFDDTLKIADIIGNKLEKKNFVLNSGCVLSLKYINEYDEDEYIPFVIKKVGTYSPSSSPSNSTEAEINRLKSENDRIRRENLELKAQIEKLTSGNSVSSSSKTTSTAPKKVEHKNEPEVEIVGSYTPPSLDKNGTIWERIDHCLKLKKDMKKTLDEILKRLNESKKKIDNFVDKAFANNPTIEDRKKALSLITEVLLLRQGFRDIDNYQEIFTKEVKEKGIKFNAQEKEKFDDSMILLGKSFPYALTPYHQQIDHLFIQVVHNFFKEKNLRFYKPNELKEVNQLKSKVM